MQKGLVLSGQVLMFTLDLGLAHRVCMYCGSGRSQAESLFAQARPGHLSPFLLLYHGIVMILLWEIHISHQRGRFWILRITRHAMLSVCLWDATIPDTGFADNPHRCLQNLTICWANTCLWTMERSLDQIYY